MSSRLQIVLTTSYHALREGARSATGGCGPDQFPGAISVASSDDPAIVASATGKYVIRKHGRPNGASVIISVFRAS